MLLNACILHVEHAKVGESNYDHRLPVLFCCLSLCSVKFDFVCITICINHPLLMWFKRKREKEENRRNERRERERM